MYKKVYDKYQGIFIFVDAWTGTSVPYELYAQNGSGIFDTLIKLVSSSTGKKALKTVGKPLLKVKQKDWNGSWEFSCR